MFYDVYSELCKKTGEKPYAVAALAGAKSNSAVAQWQKGSIPRQPVLQKIADHFGVSIDYLLTGKEKAPAHEEPELSEDEVMLLTAYRALPPDEKRSVLLLLRRAAAQDPGDPGAV